MKNKLEELKEFFENEMPEYKVKYFQDFETENTKFRFVQNRNISLLNIPIEILENISTKDIIKMLQNENWKSSIKNLKEYILLDNC